MRDRERRSAAFHEGGHAIVASVLGGIVCSVTIAPPLTVCRHRTYAAEAVTALAGNIAEQRACPASSWAADADFRRAWSVAERSSATRLEALERLLGRAEALVDKHWPSIGFVAGALLVLPHGLTGAEIDALFRSGQCCR